MPITANWAQTETTVRGEQTEIIIPLAGLEVIDPTEDRIIAQTLRDTTTASENPPPWEKLKLDRSECHLFMVVSDLPDVEQIKQLVDDTLHSASEAVAKSLEVREQAEAEARVMAQRRMAAAASLRDAFRYS